METKRNQAFQDLTSMIGALGNQDDLLDELGQLRIVELFAEKARRAVVQDARAQGFTWQQIADALGVTRQAAHERYAQRR
jgi:hypothetical protein